eukprot:TRINITY_DN8834_c0_g1_i1.p1 TRINITY_DN8834_c0_g1~~TRINITY_DN8834_c0_g1_i1.p1  ORF type:complete len:550 (+),score=150.56 TRINITY_DN8834_c0_g1_i1:194-1843(+)
MEWNDRIEGENIRLKMKIQDLKQQLVSLEKQSKESMEKESEIKYKLREEEGSVERLKNEMRELKEKLHVAEEVVEEKEKLVEEKERQLADALSKNKEISASGRSATPPPVPAPSSPSGTRTPVAPLAPPLVSKDKESDSEHSSHSPHDDFADASNTISARRPTEPVSKPYILYSPSPSPEPYITISNASPYKSLLRESSRSVSANGSPLRRISSGSSKLRRGSLTSNQDEDTIPYCRVGTVGNMPQPQGSFCLSTRSNSFASPTHEGGLEPGFEEKLVAEGISSEERQALASISIRSEGQLKYATMRDLMTVLPGPAVRKVLSCTGYYQGVTVDDVLSTVPRRSVSRSLPGERREASIPISLDDGGGRGILTENSNLRSMVAYLQTHLTYLDALGMGKDESTIPEASFPSTVSSPLPPTSPRQGHVTVAEINDDILDWPPEFSNFEGFLCMGDKKAFVVGEKLKGRKGRPWGASWGHLTEAQAIEEAKRLCLSRSPTCTIVYPSPKAPGMPPISPTASNFHIRKAQLSPLIGSAFPPPGSPIKRTLHAI